MHKEFVVNYPCLDQADAAQICGTKSGRDGDKMKLAGLKLADSKAVQVPTIEGVTVAFECEVVDQFETGDHTVFVGKVVGTSGTLKNPGTCTSPPSSSSLAWKEMLVLNRRIINLVPRCFMWVID